MRSRSFWWIFWWCLVSGAATAQPYTLKTPRAAVRTHVENLASDQYQPDLATQPFRSDGRSQRDALVVARRWQQVLDASGEIIELRTIPTDPDYTDPDSGEKHYAPVVRFPGVYLAKMDGQWRYAPESLREIDRLHGEIFPLGTDLLLKLLPDRLSQQRVLGGHAWQLVGALLIVVLCVLAYQLANLIFERILVRYLTLWGRRTLAERYILPVVRPFGYAIVVLLLQLFVPVLQLPVSVNHYVQLALRVMLPIFLTMVVYRAMNLLTFYLEKVAAKTESKLDDQLVPLVRKTAKAFILVVGTLLVLRSLDFDIATLLTGVSIGGLAFALAAQDTLKNFFGSVMIFVDRPFRIGDWITSGDIDGTVEEVGFRSTRVRTFRNSVVSVPNGKLADATVDNHGLRVYRRFYTQIGLKYDTPADLIEVFVEGLRRIVAKHPKTRKDFYEIHFNNISSSSFDIMFYIFFTVPTWSEELACRHQILMEIIRLAENIGVRLAYPTQTLHLDSFPGRAPNVSAYPQTVADMRARMEEYVSRN